MLYEKITPEEQEMIRDYIIENADIVPTMMRPLNYILSTWEWSKRDLYQLLGNKLIYSFKANTESGAIYKLNIHSMVMSISELLDTLFTKLVNDFDIYKANVITKNYLSDEGFISTENYQPITLQWSANDKYTVRPGVSAKKIIEKLCRHYGLQNEYKDFLHKYEVAATTKGMPSEITVHLSIHPLDFITMSDNSNGWRSCMAWRSNGIHRMGTLEMMNSENVLLAYITSGSNYKVGNYDWNNKLWRELFIITPEVLSEVKPYPYDNIPLIREIIAELAKLAKNNLEYDYNHINEIVYDGDDLENNIVNYFNTYVMYNDFGSMNRPHYGAYSKNVNVIKYGDFPTCVCCGNYIDSDWDYDSLESTGTNSLACNDCSALLHSCQKCGSWAEQACFNRDGTFLRTYCEECASKFWWKDDYTEEWHDKAEILFDKLYLISSNNKVIGVKQISPHSVDSIEYFEKVNLNLYKALSDCSIYYIYVDELPDNLKKFFKI